MPRRTPDAARRRLTKADAVALLDTFDADPVAALTTALRRVLVLPDATWTELVEATGWSDARQLAVRSGDQRALDELAQELNELRTLATD